MAATVSGLIRNSLENPEQKKKPELVLKKTLGARVGAVDHYLVPPSPVIKRDAGSCVHSADKNRSRCPSQGALIYGTSDEAKPQLGYLLAWCYFPQIGNDERKVVVRAGDLDLIMRSQWHHIEQLLKNFGKPTSNYEDPATGATAAAEIHVFGRDRDVHGNLVGVGGNLAAFGANFGRDKH